MKTNTHVFALYYASLVEIIGNDTLSIKNVDLVHRISRVLRLVAGDTIILFNRTMHAELRISSCTHATVTGKLVAQRKNKEWRSKITIFLSLLKRDALDNAVYNLVEAGVQEIQLVITDKVQRNFGDVKERDRLERVLVAAAEQSKNFSFPYLKEPVLFADALALIQNSPCYVADPTGTPFFSILSSAPAGQCALFVGPEGDFTPQEWHLLKEAAVIPVQLTPTVLRAETAAFFIAALFRSIFS